ncbi:hypothetical protein KIF53_15625 [Chromobacterium subtsugae]|uniref:Uncharacterized protein n=1 Tax=Chromobacterium subtsugae TaxID=251747 RepID=A0ABS7FID1_9NEIS|nr:MULTISPECIES: hypothetical protein [Chromobacterium]KUM02730.1 hypothetical protein Cv017_01375 [Chromobacterium subtsugae]KZE84949.1 hypothetical protein AWB61_02930 [Chromobacterium sp. F49]MBW7567836.1 hypothetical protein [Chromobacterium subtsugae]MBW8289063.1 hypothetical protein [Chromobacterium subtsugae]WSE93792.1 hypothetical protein U6115_11270 [Chromobacterium subtsugae]
MTTQPLTQLADAARAVIAADRAGELTDDMINALELALNAPATEQSGEAVAWICPVDLDALVNGRTGAATVQRENSPYPAPRIALCTRPLPAPAVPDEWRDVLLGNFDALEAAADSIDALGMNSHAEGIRAVAHALKQLAAAPQPAQKLPSVIEEIAAERRRQIEVEGWTPEHDDQHRDYTLAGAAGCYAMHTLAFPAGDPPPSWPWDKAWWKPSQDKRRNWIKAAALLVAAIEREDRASRKGGE